MAALGFVVFVLVWLELMQCLPSIFFCGVFLCNLMDIFRFLQLFVKNMFTILGFQGHPNLTEDLEITSTILQLCKCQYLKKYECEVATTDIQADAGVKCFLSDLGRMYFLFRPTLFPTISSTVN
jgi:hypothetical protein